MRSLANAALVALVGAVGLAAAWDVVRPAPVPRPPPRDALRALGATGQILFSDDACARRRLSLPTLEVTRVPRISGCAVFGHRGSLGIVGGEVGWYAYPGGVTMLLTRRQLEQALGAPGARVVSAAWLANTRYAALVETPSGERRLLALFDAHRLVRRVAELERRYRELRSSPRGGWFAALAAGGGLVLYDSAGEDASLPASVERPHAIAWARDDSLAAVADRGGLVLFRPGRADRQTVRVGVAARDLTWRG